VSVRTRTHTACGVLGCEPGCRDETPGEPGRNPDVLPEEIQMYCSDSIHIYRAMYEVHMCIYMLGYRYKSGLSAFFFSLNMFFLSQKRKEEDVSKTTDISNLK